MNIEKKEPTEKDLEGFSILLEDITKNFIDKHLKEYYDTKDVDDLLK